MLPPNKWIQKAELNQTDSLHKPPAARNWALLSLHPLSARNWALLSLGLFSKVPRTGPRPRGLPQWLRFQDPNPPGSHGFERFGGVLHRRRRAKVGPNGLEGCRHPICAATNAILHPKNPGVHPNQRQGRPSERSHAWKTWTSAPALQFR